MSDAVDLLDSVCERIGCKEWPQYRNLAPGASASAQPRLFWVFEQPEESPWYRTVTCRKGMSCTVARCFFAHGHAQLRRIPLYSPAGKDPVYRFEACVRAPPSTFGDNCVLRARGETERAALATAKEEAASTLLREMLRLGLDKIGDGPADGSASTKLGPPLRPAELEEMLRLLCDAARTDGALALALLEADPMAWLRELWAMLADEQPHLLARVITSAPACFSAFDREHCEPVRAAAKLKAQELVTTKLKAQELAAAARAPAPPAAPTPPPLTPPAAPTPPRAPALAEPDAREPPRAAAAAAAAPAPARASGASALELEERALSFITNSTMVKRANSEKWVSYERAPGERLLPLVLGALPEPSRTRLDADEWVSVRDLAHALSRALQQQQRTVSILFLALYVTEFGTDALELQLMERKPGEPSRAVRPCAVRRRLPAAATSGDAGSGRGAPAAPPPPPAAAAPRAPVRAEPAAMAAVRATAHVASKAPPPAGAPHELKGRSADVDERVAALEASLKARQREKRELMCRVCTQRPRACLLLPCQHLLFCMRCAANLCPVGGGGARDDADAQRHCPVCHVAVTRVVKCEIDPVPCSD